MIKNYYKILGVQPNSTQEDIKKAYRQLAHLYHSDHNKTSENEKMYEINEANEILSDPEKRRQYDTKCECEQDQYEKAQREQDQYEKAQREQAQYEKAQREQDQRERAQREQDQYEKAQREQAQRERAHVPIPQRQMQYAAGLIVVIFLMIFILGGIPQTAAGEPPVESHVNPNPALTGASNNVDLKDATYMIQKGEEYLYKSDYKEAIDCFNQAVTMDPSKKNSIKNDIQEMKNTADNLYNSGNDFSNALHIYDYILSYTSLDSNVEYDIMQKKIYCLKKLGKEKEADKLYLQMLQKFDPLQYKKYSS
jgi:curved DNA-binding protein CbpA